MINLDLMLRIGQRANRKATVDILNYCKRSCCDYGI